MAVKEIAEVTPTGAVRPARGLLLRVRVRLTASVLDARLAAGEPAWSDTDLSCRSAQLVSTRSRRGLVEGLERLWIEPRARPTWSAAVPHDRRAVSVACATLKQLAVVLRSSEEIHPRGVALTRLFLTDPGSALYRPTYPEELCEMVRAALFALDTSAAPDRHEEGRYLQGRRAGARRRHDHSRVAPTCAAACPAAPSRATHTARGQAAWSRPTCGQAARPRGDS
jgi:hypothetical protein